MTDAGVVVVGASAAGLAAAEAVRRAGHDGPVTVVGAEPHPPYTRPALSKALLRGTGGGESVYLPAPEADIGLRLGVDAVGLDPVGRRILLADGDSLPFTGLVIASGARARTMRVDGRGETVLRSLDDALALRQSLDRVSSVVILGGGFVGVEVASACAAAGVSTTLLIRHSRLMPRLGPQLSELVTGAALAAGITLRQVAGEVELIGNPVEAVGTPDGAVVAGDLVVTAVGCHPNVDWLDGSGIPIEDGVVVDSRCRAAPRITAAGDVARMRGRARTPFWTAALEQARVAGTALVRGEEASRYTPADFFWTEAFGLAVTVAGPLPAGGSAETLAGDLAQGSGLVRWRGRHGRVTVAAVNHRIARRKLRALAAEAS
jgi:3-phenylpropionate/trans-cinnamate dioxygenase ferredoxin reductase component